MIPTPIVIGDEAYLPDELCEGCHHRPRIARGLCTRCYQRRPEALAYKGIYRRRARIARLEATIRQLRALGD